MGWLWFQLTLLWWTVVLARCGSTWTAAASLLNAHVATLEIETVKGLDGSLCVFNEDELDEAESS